MELDDEGKSGKPDPPKKEAGGKRTAVSVKDDLFGDIEFDLIDEEIDSEVTINDVFARDTAIPAPAEHLSANETIRPLEGEEEVEGDPSAKPRRGPEAPTPPPERSMQLTPMTLEPPDDLEFDNFDLPIDIFSPPSSAPEPPPQRRHFGQSEMPTAPPQAARGLLEQSKRSMPAPERPPAAPDRAHIPPDRSRSVPNRAPERAYSVPDRSRSVPDRSPPPPDRSQRPAFMMDTSRNAPAAADALARASRPGSSSKNGRAIQPPPSDPAKDSALDFVDGFDPLLDSLAPPMSGLEPPEPPSTRAQVGPKEMQECYAVGDFSRALSIAEEILTRTPDDAAARRCAQNCRDVLTQMFAARIGPLDQVITVVVSPEEIQWLALDHRAGFLLSLVDGQSTVDEILDISGMTRLDALKIIFDLTERQVVKLA